MKKLWFGLLMFLCLIVFSGCSSNKLIVYTESGFAPFEYVSNGQITGVDVEIMKLVERISQIFSSSFIYFNPRCFWTSFSIPFTPDSSSTNNSVNTSLIAAKSSSCPLVTHIA